MKRETHFVFITLQATAEAVAFLNAVKVRYERPEPKRLVCEAAAATHKCLDILLTPDNCYSTY